MSTTSGLTQAEARLRVGRPDLIIPDLNLGLIDGLVVLRQLGTASRLAGLPIVILTFHIRALDLGTCLAAGARRQCLLDQARRVAWLE